MLHGFVIWPGRSAGAGCACHGNASQAVSSRCVSCLWPPAYKSLAVDKPGAVNRTAISVPRRHLVPAACRGVHDASTAFICDISASACV